MLTIIFAVTLLCITNSDESPCNDDTCIAPIPTNELLSTSTITLNDGNKIPIVGLGTWLASRTARSRKYWDNTELYSTDKNTDIMQKSKDDFTADQQEEQQFKNAIITAVKAGYRHIDSAVVYRTEKVVGEALNELYQSTDINIKREDIWITTKVPRPYRNRKQVRDGIEESLKLLRTDYIDLYLIHSPHTNIEEGQRGKDVLEIYKILLEYKKKGKIKSVGVSNFGIEHLKSIEKNGLPLPSVNQIEASVFLVEEELIWYCNENGIVIEAYSPIAQAHDIAKYNDILLELADKYGKENNKKLTFAHIMIRWCIEKGFVVLPKSVTPSRIIANGDVFDFTISEQDMKTLDQLKEENYRICWNPLEVEWDV
eukprot:92080_1